MIKSLLLPRSLLHDLKKKFISWSPAQCLGDVFVKYSEKFNTFVNFLKNYPTILITIERCTELYPTFRAFLNRHERTPQTKMLTLVLVYRFIARNLNKYWHIEVVTFVEKKYCKIFVPFLQAAWTISDANLPCGRIYHTADVVWISHTSWSRGSQRHSNSHTHHLWSQQSYQRGVYLWSLWAASSIQ